MPPSVPRLYRHALESVFAFCELKELAALLRVSKEWAAAVLSMRSLKALVVSKALLSVCASRLSRHIHTLYRPSPLSPTDLSLLARQLPHLHCLRCSFRDHPSMLVFPARLRELSVQFEPSSPGALFSKRQLRDIDAVIAVISALPMLESLTLSAIKATSCCLTPLAFAPALHTLTFRLPRIVFDSPAATSALRSMPHLRSLDFFSSSVSLTRLLQAPHSMNLDTLLVCGSFTAEHGAAIVHHPSLTYLSFSVCSPHTDFFYQLPNLRRLTLLTAHSTVPLDADRIMHSLHSLVGLTRLCIIGPAPNHAHFPLHITTDHLAACLLHMPLLTYLSLSGASPVDSLRFLSTGPITRSLKQLELDNFHPCLPLGELLHVHALSSLTKLTLRRVFDRPLDERVYTPPSSLLPALQQFEYA
jgi:hypothetical protein